MEQIIWNNIQAIKTYRRDRDRAIKFVNIQIGLYRLNAERYYGFVRRNIHKQANEIEEKLMEAMKELEPGETIWTRK